MDHKITEGQIIITLILGFAAFFFVLGKGGIIWAIPFSSFITLIAFLAFHSINTAQQTRWYLNRKKPIFIIGRHPKTRKMPDVQLLIEQYQDDVVICRHKKIEAKKLGIQDQLEQAKNKHRVEVVTLWFQQPVDKQSGVESWDRIEGQSNSYPHRIESTVLELLGKAKHELYKGAEKEYGATEGGIDVTWSVQKA